MNSTIEFFKIAHRGASFYEPENTIRSFRRAIEMRADMIEFDVRLSADGELVVMHDEMVDRTTNGAGLVRAMTLGELKALDAGLGEKIPTFEEVVGLAEGRTGLVIELKESGTEERVVESLIKRNLTDNAFIVSFHRDLLKTVKRINPAVRTGLILFSHPNPTDAALECGANAVAPYCDYIAAETVKAAAEAGLVLITWTVDDAGKAARLRDMGVRGIVTNKPDVI
ncbi:MAG: glycerophosphodiester phosphodiesterase [Deltaproteobacteria bacterium]